MVWCCTTPARERVTHDLYETRQRVRIGVKIVFTTSSKTFGARSMRAGAERAPREVVVAPEFAEAGQVLVEAEHLRDDVGKLRFETARGGLDPQLPAGRRDAHRAAPCGTGRVVSSARPARSTRFGGSSATPCETNRPREVDRLSSRSTKR
jgi:hypothetical protein